MKWMPLTVSLVWANLSWAEGIIEVTGHAKLLQAASSNALHKANQHQLGPVTYISELGNGNAPRPVFAQARSAMADATQVPASLQAGNVQLGKQLLVRYTLND